MVSHKVSVYIGVYMYVAGTVDVDTSALPLVCVPMYLYIVFHEALVYMPELGVRSAVPTK